MALTLSKTGISNGGTIQAPHVTQSVDALTGIEAYDIKISGSLNLTGSVASFSGFTGSLNGNADTSTGHFYPNGVGPVTQNAKLLAGSATLNGASPATVVVTAPTLAGKTLGLDCFVTATISGSTSYTDTVYVGTLSAGSLSFFGNNSNNKTFYFTVIYY
jgi:hypothetical protein